MTANVARHLGYAKPKSGDIAFELEIESEISLEGLKIPGWKRKEEGSLRFYGSEFVSDGPVPLVSAKDEVERLCSVLNDETKKVTKDCPRAGLHVHLNVGDLTPLQYWTGATAYWAVENCLFKSFGKDREGNLFCLRLKDADGVLQQCIYDVRQTSPFRYLGTDIVRYAGQNVNATPKFCSIEYRGMPSTTDPKLIYKWGSELHGMFKKAGKSYASPASVLDSYMYHGADYIIDSLFSKEFSDELKGYQGYKDGVEQNILPLCDFAYVHSWDDWEKKIDKSIVHSRINDQAAGMPHWAQEFISDESLQAIDAIIPAAAANNQGFQPGTVGWASQPSILNWPNIDFEDDLD